MFQIILCCRNVASGQSAANEIRTQLPDAELEVMQLDLASFKSINNFADKLSQTVHKVDILINNAGVMMTPKTKSEDYIELQFATNHLGHFLLTKRVLPLMAKSHDARILNVSSVHHVRGQIFFEDINMDKEIKYDPVEAYCQSKMANVLFSAELARRLASYPKYANVKTYSLNPGTINTNLTRHVSGTQRFFFDLIGTLFNLDVYAGTQTTLYCALSPEVSTVSGLYYRFVCL